MGGRGFGWFDRHGGDRCRPNDVRVLSNQIELPCFGGPAELGLSSIVRLAQGVEIIAQSRVVYGMK
jgi:hypothetical protein